MGNQWIPRDSLPRQPNNHHQPRYTSTSNDQRRHYDEGEHVRSTRPMAIDVALKKAGIWAKQYFVAAIMADGKAETFCSPYPSMDSNIVPQFFDIKQFEQVARSLEPLTVNAPDSSARLYDGPYSRIGSIDSHKSTSRQIPIGPETLNRPQSFHGPKGPVAGGGDDDGSSPYLQQARKRPRYPLDDNEDISPPMMTRRGLTMEDERGLWKFYDQRFKQCQQSACKLIAKAWVKAVEPKKQSTHPYTGSDEKAPDWWPKAWGPTKEDKVRHKEPDHLYKRERVHLLKHILDMVVNVPTDQHEAIRKVGLNVKKLEECTNEALSGFYAENDANSAKKQFLNEVFKVARQQERYKHGEIDGETTVMVLNNHRIFDPRNPENAEGVYPKEEDQDTPPSAATQGFHHTPGTGQSPGTASHRGSFMGELPVRNPQQISSQLLQDMNGQLQHHSSLVEAGDLVNGQTTIHTTAPNIDLLPGPHDESRRSSMYNEYQANGIYPQWQAATAGTSNQNLYGPQGVSHAPNFVSANLPGTHAQQYLSTPLDRLPQPNYDQNQTPLFRGELQQPPVGHHQHAYTYMQNGTR